MRPLGLGRPAVSAAALLVLLASLSGCSSEPVAPPPPPPTVTSLSVWPQTATVRAGETVPTTITAAGTGAAGVPVTWSTGDPRVATVDGSGLITAVGDGAATITASAGTATAKVTVTVAPAGLARIVDSVRRAWLLPAMGGAIVTAAGTEALAVAGNRRITPSPPVEVTDRWHIGSNLKAITSALAAIAVDEGKIQWTTTVAEALPDLAATIRPAYRNVSLADLLAHRGAIRNDPPLAAFAGTTAAEQRRSLATWMLSADPVGPVGAFSYSNPGYVLAAVMLERAWGVPYEDRLTDRILAPLDMTGFGWGPQALAGASDQPVAHSWAADHWLPCEGCDNLPGLSAAGRAHLPLGAWARMIREFLLAYQGRSAILSPAAGRQLFSGRVDLGGGDQYGLGWVLTSRTWAGGPTAAHEGTNTVNHSVAWLALERGLGFIAVTNAGDLTTGRTGRALDALIGRLIGYHETGR